MGQGLEGFWGERLQAGVEAGGVGEGSSVGRRREGTIEGVASQQGFQQGRLGTVILGLLEGVERFGVAVEGRHCGQKTPLQLPCLGL